MTETYTHKITEYICLRIYICLYIYIYIYMYIGPKNQYFVVTQIY